MFKKIQFLLAVIICVTTLSMHAVIFKNKSSQQIVIEYFTFISGIEIGKLPVTLKPNEKFKQDDIKSFNIKYDAQKPTIAIKDLTDKTTIILKKDLTHTRDESTCSIL